jgi:hypothetical protein
MAAGMTQAVEHLLSKLESMSLNSVLLPKIIGKKILSQNKISNNLEEHFTRK